MENITMTTLKQIKENCRKVKCKECEYYITGEIMDHCLFDDTPLEWRLYKLEKEKMEK